MSNLWNVCFGISCLVVTTCLQSCTLDCAAAAASVYMEKDGESRKLATYFSYLLTDLINKNHNKFRGFRFLGVCVGVGGVFVGQITVCNKMFWGFFCKKKKKFNGLFEFENCTGSGQSFVFN